MTNLVSLQLELDSDPLGRGYATMTDAEVSASLSVVDRSLLIDSMSGDEVFSSTDTAEFVALTDAKKSQWLAFCARTSVDPFGVANVAFVQYTFGAGATSLSNLSAARTTANGQTRGQEIGVGYVNIGDVLEARA
jgi:hypothetical protein